MLINQRKLFFRSRLAVVLCAAVLGATACRQNTPILPAANQEMPRKILWAWERPEDLRFLDAGKFGVAFLAQTLTLKNGQIIHESRRQSLRVAPDVYLIAVTRIETAKQNSEQPDLSDSQKEKIVFLIKKTLELPNVRAVQIDFDATVSERDFYRAVVVRLKKELPEKTPLTMTALASWCVGDAWFGDFPVDEAVPMAFEMGADAAEIRKFVNSGRDWREPLCRGSYGIAVDEPLNAEFQPNRRFFYFKSKAWEKADTEKLD